MKPVKVISLAFMNSDIIEKSFDRLYETKNPDLPIDHHVLFQHYPINKEENLRKLQDICRKHNIVLHDAGRNLGLHEGFNFLFRKLNPDPSEIVIGYDPDSYPIGVGWDLALVRAIDGSTDTVWASLMNPRSRGELTERGYDKEIVDGYLHVWKTKHAVANSVCAFKYDWLLKVGFTEPRPFYGHFESEMFNKLKGKRWAFVCGWTESDHLRDLHDRPYVEWKWAHAHLKTFDGDFKSWLEAGSPIPGRAPVKLP